MKMKVINTINLYCQNQSITPHEFMEKCKISGDKLNNAIAFSDSELKTIAQQLGLELSLVLSLANKVTELTPETLMKLQDLILNLYEQSLSKR